MRTSKFLLGLGRIPIIFVLSFVLLLAVGATEATAGVEQVDGDSEIEASPASHQANVRVHWKCDEMKD
eukprot:1194611-Prorocentrum_minimum.AAC.13